MTLETWWIYVATVLALMSTPGPSHLLMLSNSAASGFRRSLATAAGDLFANALQMLAAGLGLAAVVTASGNALAIVKWLGVAWLLWLGAQALVRAGRRGNPGKATPRSLRTLWLQGFLTSAANPKAVVFFAALFPQFIDGAKPFWPQFLVLSASYILIDGTFLATYGACSSWIARKIRGHARVWIDRAGGGFMILAALLLGLKTIRQG